MARGKEKDKMDEFRGKQFDERICVVCLYGNYSVQSDIPYGARAFLDNFNHHKLAQ